MNQAADFALSFALFECDGRLVEWNAGFAEEFADAARLLAPGLALAAIRDNCLVPERALDLSWAAGDGMEPPPFNYINRRRSIEVTQERSASGRILRLARASGAAAQVHREISDQAADLLRSSVLQMSNAVLVRRNQEEEGLRLARAAAEAANQAKSQFLATMSHEIRTPLNGVLGMAQMLLQAAISEDERQDCVRTIYNSGKMLLTVLNDVLDLSKVEAGKIDLESLAFQPAQIIDEAVRLFGENARNKGLRLECDWRGPPEHYRSDPTRLRQMINNLVGNAIKFTNKGFVRIEGAEIERDEQAATLEFAVVDSGVGIPEDKLKLLFQPFSQVDASTTRQYGGTGLGLSIVLKLAKLMGGEAGVISKAGEGSRFRFRIRAELAAGAEEEKRAEERSHPVFVAGARPSLDGLILAVDDNSTNQRVLAAMLKSLSLRFDVATNGREAVDAVTGGDFDLVLMDCQMPVMDGYQATRTIRAWEQAEGRPRLPILGLSASSFPEEIKGCIAAGMDDFLDKPVDIDKLACALANWLARAPDRPAPAQALATADSAKPPSLDGAVLDNLREIMGDVFGEFVDAVLDDAPVLLDRLRDAAQRRDAGGLRAAAHALKGMAANIGAAPLGGMAKALEIEAAEARLADVDGRIAALRVEFARVTARLEEARACGPSA